MTTNSIQLSVQYLQAGDLDRAEETVRGLLRENSAQVQGWCLLGVIRQARGRPDEALPLFQEAARLDPRNADVYNFAGAAHIQMRQPRAALACLEEALRLNPHHAEAYNNLGKVHLLEQRAGDALGCFREAVRLQPNNIEALNNLALLLIGGRQFDEAQPLLERLVGLAPNFAGAWVSLATLRFEKADLEPALEAARKAIQLDPRLPAAQDLLGVVLLKLERPDEALAHLQAVVETAPNYTPAVEHLGLVLLALGRREEGLAVLQRAIDLNPANLRALNNRIATLIQLGRWQDVAQAAERAMPLHANAPELQHNLGLAYLHLKHPHQAIAPLEEAVKLRPNYPEALCSLGWAFTDLGRLDLALTTLQRAHQLKPDFPEILNNLGLVYNQLGKLDESCNSFEQALRLRPDFPEALAGLANSCKDLGRIDEAIACYRKSVALNPRQSLMYSNLLFALHYSPSATPEEIFQEHQAWARHNVEPPVASTPHSNQPDPQRRLRIGYVSADFRGHVMGWYIEPVLESHDRSRFEIYCYANQQQEDDTTQRIRSRADHWRGIHNRNDDTVEKMIRDDRIDLLVDLSGHTGANRLPLFARKPAPVQASHFGYMDTSGVPAIDYRITDAVCDPPGMTERYHSEQLVRLPEILWCYRPNLSLEVNDLPADLTGHLTLGMLNAFPKISPPAIRAWSAILKHLPDAKLMLLAGVTPQADQRLRDAFAEQGVNPERLILEGKRSRPDYFRLFHRVDLLLDSFPYSGCNTTCDALWMGVPVVTLAGQTCMARQGASPLAHLGLHDLIADTADDYVRKAVRLAEDLPALRDLRATLRQRMVVSTLMNPERFTRQLEEAYRWMWQQWCETNEESPLL